MDKKKGPGHPPTQETKKEGGKKEFKLSGKRRGEGGEKLDFIGLAALLFGLAHPSDNKKTNKRELVTTVKTKAGIQFARCFF